MEQQEAFSLGRAIARVRKERGVSQRVLGVESGLGLSRVRSLENGRYQRAGGRGWGMVTISPQELKVIADALAVTADEIAGYAELRTATRQRLRLDNTGQTVVVLDGQRVELSVEEESRVADFVRRLIADRGDVAAH